jgi:5'-3' exoribonuclease 1
MGVPSLFLSLIKNKSYKNILTGIEAGKANCDYLLLDFNALIYDAHKRVEKALKGRQLNKVNTERHIIQDLITHLQHLICDIIQPKKCTYFAVDGPAPRAKMIQQRSRRYRGYQTKIFINQLKDRLGLEIEEQWDASANIAPGTEFMQRMTEELEGVMRQKGFSRHNQRMEVVLSTSNIPGEAEHKIMPIMRNLMRNSKTIDDVIYIDSKDADLIVLSTMTHKNNVHIIRRTMGDRDLEQAFSSFEFASFNIDALREGWERELMKDNQYRDANAIRILNDYNFLTFIVGNDFVPALSYMKVKRDGLKILRSIYNDIKRNHAHYLVDYDPFDASAEPRLNNAFLKDLFVELAKREDKGMKEEYRLMKRLLGGYKDERRQQSEEDMTPYQLTMTRYDHLEVCSPDHPLFGQYHEEFKRINFDEPKEVWREKFYEYFLGVTKENMEEYNRMRIDMAMNYVESLVFNLKYYFKGVPSWTWNYRHRSAPLPSDVVYLLKNVCQDVNAIHFEMGTPFTPFEQLMLILPPQNNDLIPVQLRPVMTNPEYGCVQYYPESFRLDVLSGIKTIYSEGILPEIDVEVLMGVVRQQEGLLGEDDKKRNQIQSRPLKFV